MAKKFSNKIIVFLVIILISLLTYINIAKLNNDKETINSQQVQLQINNEVEQWKAKEELIKNELTRISKLAVLQGEIEIKRTYTKTLDEIDYQGNSTTLQWLRDKLNTLKTKDISIQTTYQYNLMYDLSKINVHVNNLETEVSIHILGLGFLPVSELSDKRIIASETRMLSGEFSTSEVSAVMKETSDYTQDLIIHDNKLYYQGLENTKASLEELMKNLGVENVRITVIE